MQLTAIVFVLMCVPAQIILAESEFVEFHLKKKSEASYESRDDLDGSFDSVLEMQTADSDNHFTRQLEQAEESQVQPRRHSLCSFLKAFREALRMTRGLLAALCYTFLLTFFVFPGLSQAATHLSFLEGHGAESSAVDAAWLSLILLTTFNVMDTLGRYLAGVSCMSMTRLATLALTYLRTLQVGLFLCSAFDANPQWLLGSDAFKLLNFSVFAFTNGYYSSLQSMQVPEVVKSST